MACFLMTKLVFGNFCLYFSL